MLFTKLYVAVLTAFTSNKGAAMAEYALLIALIAVAAILAVTGLGNGISTKFQSITRSLR